MRFFPQGDIIEAIMRRIYMDYAATAPVDAEVLAKMMPFFSELYGNPSSVHGAGVEAQGGVIAARRSVAEFLNCNPDEVVFTSGATEGNNAVIRSFAGPMSARRVGGKPHIIVSSIEHDCILGSAMAAEMAHEIELTILPVNGEGTINPDSVFEAIKKNTVLVSVMYANNETGAIQFIPRIGKILKEVNKDRDLKVYFHTDAAQAANYLDCDVDYLGVDMITLSGHKVYGPKGVGILFVRDGVSFDPLMKGGEQEFHKRAGTHNVTGIVGMGAAIRLAVMNRGKIMEIIKLRDRLIDGILSSIQGSALSGPRTARLPNNANIRFSGCNGGDILKKLSDAGVFVSTGSACAAKSVDPSHVLLAMGVSSEDALSAIRFSIGRYTTPEEIDYVLEILPGIVNSLRRKPETASTDNFSAGVDNNSDRYPEVTVAKAGYQTVMDSRLPVSPMRYGEENQPLSAYPDVVGRASEDDIKKKYTEDNSEMAVLDRISPAANASFGELGGDSSPVKFYGDEEINRGGLPADLGCERSRKAGEEE